MDLEQEVRTWLKVDSNQLRENFSIIRSMIGDNTKLMVVAKSNAYGYGLVEFSQIAAKFGADFLAVDTISAALKLRKAGLKLPILVFGFTLPDFFKIAKKQNIHLTVSNFEALRLIKKSKYRPNIHLKIDTGMHRLGFLEEDWQRIATKAKQLPIAGIYTHFAAAKDPENQIETEKQFEKFREALSIFAQNGIKPALIHAAATPAIFNFPQSLFSMVRIASGLLGFWPNEKMREKYSLKYPIKPALAWKSIVIEVKKLPKGAKIGYEFTKTLEKDSKIAIIPVGYWHGYPRALSNKGFVLVNGQRAPIIGQISMDMMTIDVSEVGEVEVGTKVTLIGKDHNLEITIDELAGLAGLYRNEFAVGINSRIRRVYV